MFKQFLISCILVFFSTLSHAQSNCAENLETANKYIEQGKIAEAIDLAKPCSNDYGNASRPQAMRILTIAFIIQNKNDSALYYARQMLELNPLYKTNLLNDPKDFTVLLKKINIIPRFTLGLAFMYGFNYTYPQVTGTYIPTDYTKKYKRKGGYQLGLVAGYNFNKSNGLDINLIGNSRKYTISYTSFGSEIKIDETINSLDFPLIYRHTFFHAKRLRLNIMAGPYGSLLLNSYNDLSIKDTTQDKEIKRYSSKVRRNNFSYGFVGGLGLIYKLREGHISLDARYYKSLSNITKTEGRYDNATLIYNYAYLDDDLRLDNIAFSFGLHYYLNYKLSR